LYLQDFGNSIHEDYIIKENDVVGSGSIGQVYKCFCKKTNEYIAMKVKHPGINNNVDITVYALKIVCFLLQSINHFHYVFIQYIDNIYLQIDYTQESINTIKLKEKFKNERIVVIPEIYNYSSNFITMSYHDAKNYNEVNHQQQLLASMYINFIFLTSTLVYDYLHADLHHGNWKIIENGNDIKILMYDCGIMCETGDIDFNIKLVDITASGRCRFIEVFDLIIKNNPKLKNKIDKHRHEFMDLTSYDNKSIKSTQTLSLFLRKMLKLRLIQDKNIINLITSISIIGDTPKQSVEVFIKYIMFPTGTTALLYHVYLDLIIKMGTFKDLELFLREYLITSKNKDGKTHTEIYQDWLYEEFGHKKGYIVTDIIYKLFFPETKSLTV
jgi:predicted Ser/Thr protein kinase